MTEQLQPIEHMPEETIDNELWVITAAFRRAFFYHNVFLNKTTKEYAFHVSDGDLHECRHDDFPNFGRHRDYHEMMEAVVNKYAILWKIHD